MISTRRVIGLLGQNPKTGRAGHERAAEIVAHFARFGQRIRLTNIGTVPETNLEMALMGRYLTQSEKFRIGYVQSRGRRKSLFRHRLDTLNAKIHTLQTSSRIRKSLGGRIPTIHHVFAAQALLYGLDSKKLKEAAGEVVRSEMAQGNKGIIEGTGKNIYNVIRANIPGKSHNYLFGIEEALHKNAEPIDSISLAQKAGLQWNKNAKNFTNSSLQILELCGLAKKLPEITAWRGNISIWVSTGAKPLISFYRNKLGGYKNPWFDIFGKLSGGAKYTTDMYKESKSPTGKSGSKSAIYAPDTIFTAIRRMEKNGLVKTRVEIEKRGPETGAQRVGAAVKTKVELTEDGKKIWGEIRKTGIINSGLIKIMLGAKSGLD